MWQAYYSLEPFGDLRADMRTATSNSLLFNINRSRNTPATSPKEWMLKFEPDSPAQKLRAALQHRVIVKGK